MVNTFIRKIIVAPMIMNLAVSSLRYKAKKYVKTNPNIRGIRLFLYILKCFLNRHLLYHLNLIFYELL